MALSNDNLELKRNVWFAVIGIPKTLRPIIGRSKLIESTGERDQHKARLAAVPILARMRQRIADARANAIDPIKSEAATLARKFMEARNMMADDTLTLTITDAITFVMETMPKASAPSARVLLTRTADVAMAVASVPGAAEAFGLITGTMTPFTIHQAAWEAAKAFNAKTLHEYRVTLAGFAANVGKPCEAIVWNDVRGWRKALETDGNSPATISKKLACVGGYWRWMVEERLIVDNNKPFDGQRIARSKKAEAAAARRRFDPIEMVRVLAAAYARCQALGDLVMLAMYTGSRREALAGLNVRNVKPAAYGMPAHFHFDDKTGAGIRDVPIHAAIVALVDRLVKNATADGQLFHGNADSFGDYGVALGQKFGQLKTAMGFDHRYTFHSIRKTVAFILTEAHVSEKTTNDICGWENQTMQAHYAQEASLHEKARALTKLVYPVE